MEVFKRLMNKNQRRIARNKLRKRDGDDCYWCNTPMYFPQPKESVPDDLLDQLATVEHYWAKLTSHGDDLEYLRLAHMKCNR